ncbi:hypothetical protein GCM10027569_92320 [Flindersiella endophytica]
MLMKLEMLGDRLLSLMVPRARASADCWCEYLNRVCDRTRDWWLCYGDPPGAIGGKEVCSAFNPCG